jgi:hypothetical protein
MIRRLFNSNKAHKLRNILNPFTSTSYTLQNTTTTTANISASNENEESVFSWLDFAKKPSGFGKFNRGQKKEQVTPEET